LWINGVDELTAWHGAQERKEISDHQEVLRRVFMAGVWIDLV